MKYLAISRHSTIQLLLMIVASNAFVYQYNSVFIAILNPLNIHIDDLLTSYIVTGRFSIMGPLDNSVRFSTGWPMWAFTKAWAKLHMGFYEYIVHILLNYVVQQAGGFASPTATFFCMLCNLKIQDIENLDKCTWPERDAAEHVWFARRWRDAQTTKEQETLFKDYGIRWSPLLNLPYWNPILFTAIEPMHVFDVRLFQTHCWQVWGIDTTALSGDGLAMHLAMYIPRPLDSKLGECYEVICKLKKPEDLREQLKGCSHDTLWNICSNNELHHAGQKLQL